MASWRWCRTSGCRGIRRRERGLRDRVPYEAWAEQGLIELTEGNVIDYAALGAQIARLGERYDIREIAYDRWGATQLVQDLQGAGFLCVPMGQGFASMAAPTKELLNLTLSKKLRHGGNPVLRWMADNLVVRQDPAGNVKPDKSKSTEKIDGMVALIMGLDRAIRNEAPKPSIYETRGLASV
jgi:phage terminase large subunit-like protein